MNSDELSQDILDKMALIADKIAATLNLTTGDVRYKVFNNRAEYSEYLRDIPANTRPLFYAGLFGKFIEFVYDPATKPDRIDNLHSKEL